MLLGSRLALAFVLSAALIAPPEPDRAHAWDDGEEWSESDAPAPDDYGEALAPYGSWVDLPGHGPVWHPWVGAAWQPYLDGYWAWSSWGWLWVSYEPFGWTYHYGRWALVPVHGWVWVPGTVWGPAWVDWYWGDGFVGWAPLSPFAHHVAVFNHFVFVREPYFCSRTLARHRINRRRVPNRVVERWRHRDSRPPDRHRIERVTRHPLRQLSEKPANTLAPRRDRRAARPDRPDARPGRRPGDRADRARRPERAGRPERARPAPGVVERRPTGRGPAADPPRRLRPVDPGRSRPNPGRPGWGARDGEAATRPRQGLVRPGGGAYVADGHGATGGAVGGGPGGLGPGASGDAPRRGHSGRGRGRSGAGGAAGH